MSCPIVIVKILETVPRRGIERMILVSACLAGFPCRWDGSEKSDPAVVELVRRGKAIPVCPEQLGGLPTPREPSERSGGRIIAKSGRDVTAQFERGAAIVLGIALKYGCREAILKARSPSCGAGVIYDGTFGGGLAEGDGVATELLKKNGISVRTAG